MCFNHVWLGEFKKILDNEKFLEKIFTSEMVNIKLQKNFNLNQQSDTE